MELIVSLIMVPCVAALLMLVVRADKARDVLCVASAAVIALLSIAFAVQNLGAGSLYFDLPMEYSHFLAVVNIVIDITVGLYIVCYSVKYRRVLPLVLAIGQILTTLWFEYNIQREVQFESQMHVDSLSIIMVLILGIVGTGICVYALGYMKDFQAHHPEQKDRRPWFFALMFAFLSAMYNVVLSDNLCWIYTAWEVTTLCSFLLIGFTKTEEAINNAFRQIVMNMLGGLAFQAAILWLGLQGESRLFSVFLKTAANAAVARGSARVRRHDEGGADAVPHVAFGRYGCAYTHQRASAFFHHGESWLLPAYQALAAVPGFPRGVGHGRAHWRPHVLLGFLHGHLAEQR